VLRETTSRGLCGLVCPSRTSERGGEGDCVCLLLPTTVTNIFFLMSIFKFPRLPPFVRSAQCALPTAGRGPARRSGLCSVSDSVFRQQHDARVCAGVV
jgi:hypothetical protein